MAEEPYFTPGQSDGVPPQSPTQFSPAKPAGPDPVSPQPVAEGSEIGRHAQLYALDPATGQFHPLIRAADGRLKVESSLIVKDIQIGAVEIKDADGDQRVNVVTVGDLIDGLNALIVTNREMGNSRYFQLEDSIGIETNHEIDFGGPMKDVYLLTNRPMVVRFNGVVQPPISISRGQFDWNSIWAMKMFLTTTSPTDFKVFANG